MDDDFCVQKFILEIRNRPAIWKTDCPEYGTKVEKIKAWRELCELFFEGFSEKSPDEKHELYYKLQRRWKSLRNCFSREVALQKKKDTTESGRQRRTYIFYENLSFLLPHIQLDETHSNIEEINDEPEDTNNKPDTIVIQPKQRRTMPRRRSCARIKVEPIFNESQVALDESLTIGTSILKTNEAQKRSLESTNEESLPHLSPKRLFVPHCERFEDDEDRMFIMSLLKEFKKTPEENKLDLKTEMLQLLKKWRIKHEVT